MARRTHGSSVDPEDDRLAAPSPHGSGGVFVRGQVDVMPLHSQKALLLYRGQQPSDRTVKQDIGWLGWLVTELHVG